MGVTRIFEKTNIIHDNSNASTTTTTASMGPNGKFGVEIPLLFYKGRKVILRDFDREDVAGLLFGFLCRLLFGNKALHDMSIVVNEKCERKDSIHDALCAFGALLNLILLLILLLLLLLMLLMTIIKWIMLLLTLIIMLLLKMMM